MPDLTTHLFFSIKLYNKVFSNISRKNFLIGVIAPDCVMNEEFIKKSHFLNNEDMIGIETLKSLPKKLHNIEPNNAFYLGYLTHLYLDYYFDKYSNKIPLLNIEPNEHKIDLLKNIKKYNMIQIRKFFYKDEEMIADLGYEYRHQAQKRLNDLMFIKNEMEYIDYSTELGEYVELIDGAISDFIGDGFLNQKEYNGT